MRVAYADPPYLGCCGLYGHFHPDGRCWDDPETHELLFASFDDYDGALVHASVPSLLTLLPMLDGRDGWRTMAWVKPFAAFKKNVSVAYAWEPVLVRACRKPVVTHRVIMRDFYEAEQPLIEEECVRESITLKRGLTGAKPEKVCRWAFEMLGLEPTDHLVDLYPGSGAVTRAWETWRNELRLDGVA